MKRRCLSILLALCMVMTLLPTTVWAVDSDFTIENGVLTQYSGPGGDVEIPSNVTSIGSYAFYNCFDLTNVTIPSSVTSIEEGAFFGCSNLNSINISSGVTSIGKSAFVRCTSLTNVVIPNGVTSIEESTFDECTGLTSVSLPDSITNIGGAAFNSCSSLTNLSIPEKVVTIGESAFSGCHGLKNIILPNSVKNIGLSAFSNCHNLESINIPQGVTSIDFQTFYGCNKLTSISIPDSVVSIGEGVFYNCTGLKSVALSDGLTSIGFSAFDGCSNLESINIPNSVIDIDGQAFTDCKSLTSINIPNRLTSIKSNVFSGCENLVNIEIPDTVTEIGYAAFSSCKKLQHINIPYGVTSIGSLAFNFCTSLTDITIPNGIDYIGGDAFRNCSALVNVSLPNDLPYIASGMFDSCSKLTEINIPNSITSIGSEAFFNCIQLRKINIPSNATSIGNGAFSGCSSLTSVSLPISITSIGERAFADNEFAKSGLTDIYYSGNETQWNTIKINSYDNSKIQSATIHYNSTGPDDVGPDNMNSVYFLSGWDAATRTVQFGDNTLSTPDKYTVADSVDVSNIASLLNKYVLVTMEQGNSSLEYTITDIQPVESKIGTVSATGEHSLTIDGTTYPVRQNSLMTSGMYDGKEILYHVSNGTIVGFNVLEEKSGTLETWNSTTGQATIDGVVYPTNYLSDLSFQNNISDYLQKGVYFVTSGSSDYHPLLRITGFYYPGGKLEDFNADIYHATWLSKHGNAADMLEDKTPSEILIDVVSDGNGDLAIDLWRSFELVFDTLDDVTTLHDFAVKPRDMYSALILDALEASVSYDVVASEFEDSLKRSRECLSAFSTFVKTDKGIDLNNNDEFQDIVSRMPGVDVDAYTEEFISDWYKKNYPNATDISKSLGYISKGLKVVGSLEDFAEYCAACETLMNVSDSMKAVLERAYLKSAEVYGPNDNMTQAFNDCLQMITRSTDEMFDQIEKEAVAVVGKAGIKYLVSNVLWKKVSDQIQISCPEVAILQLGYKTGKTISNQLCNTDDAAEKYLKMDYITDIESMIDVVYRDLEFDFDRDSTLDLAQEYLSAMELSFRLRDVDCETAHSYVDNIQDSALGSLKELLGGSDYEGLKSAINRTKDEYAQHYTLSETDWIAHLEEDYPGSGLYELYSAIYEAIIGSGGNVKLVKQIIAACPVDVYVYDQSNNVVASVINGRVSCSKDDVMIALVDNQKIIRFYDGADYRIEYIGYNTGDMDITITEFNGNENIQRTVNYYDLSLTNGKTYSMDANDEILKPYDLVDKASNSTVQHDYDSLDINAAHTIKIVSGTLQQSGELFAETTASKGETLQLNAYVPDGYEFVRWESSSANALIANINSVNTTLIMPDEDLTVTAIMRETSSPGVTHTVTFNPNGGTVSLSTAITTPSGKLTTMPTPILSGYTFDGWFTLASGGSKITTDYVFTSDTTVYAHWTKNSGGSSGGGSTSSGGSSNGGSSRTSYSITAGNSAHGSVSVSPKSASKGTKVTLTIQPDSGYELDSLVVKDTKGNAVKLTKESHTKYTFTMPNSKVTIDATFTEIEQQPSSQIRFTDVNSNTYYYDAVAWAVEQGITSGTTAITFSPDAPCTRAQIVTFLWRAAGSPVMGENNPFTDVTPGSYYYDAVQWAVAQGITVGTSANTFSPDVTCTRGQAVTFLYRYEKSPVVSGGNAFTDVPSNAYYTNAVQWAVNSGVTSGTSATTFSPNATCTRGQIVTFLYRDMA